MTGRVLASVSARASGHVPARVFGALLAGALQAAAMVPVSPGLWQGAPTSSPWQALPALLQLASLVGLVHLLWTAARPREGALLGFLFGLAWLGGTFWWLFISMHRYGGLPAWMAVLAVLALAAFLALYTAAAAAAWVRWGGASAGLRIVSFAAWWCLAEWARARWFTGFPWGAAGYAHVDGPLAGWAPYVGVYGIGAVAAALAASLYAAARLGLWRGGRGGRGALVAALLLVAVPQTLPQAFTSPGARLTVALLQGNVPQEEKFESRYLYDALSWHVQTLARTDADLVVAPETAIPLLPDQLPPGLWAALVRRFGEGRQHALIGLPLGDEQQGYTNSARGLGPEGDRYRYDKHHLVPFGEFIPFGFRWFVRMMDIPLGDFDRGPLVAPSWPVRGARIGPNICYEDLYGEELAARFVDVTTAPTVLANLSNIGWFGPTVAVGQHLQIARMRSLELQRPTVRATNTGATAVIDPAGRVTAALTPYTVGVLKAEVQGREGVTPYAWWAGRFGLWPLVLCAMAAALGCAVFRRR